VVFAVQDPNPRVRGQGAAALQRAGISVAGGLMEAEATELNAGFMKRMQVGIPLVRLKLAMSLDGRTALANGASQWITGNAAREDVQRWRARSSAVVTGVGTVLADDPRLDVRLPGENRRQPMRVVLDSQFRTPPGAKLFGVGGEVLIFGAASTASEIVRRQAGLEARGARIEAIPAQVRVDLQAVLQRLAELEMNELLVEAGATLAGRLIEKRLVDELLLYVAPKLLGPQARPLVDLPSLQALQDAWQFSLHETTQIGDDLRIRLRPRVV